MYYGSNMDAYSILQEVQLYNKARFHFIHMLDTI